MIGKHIYNQLFSNNNIIDYEIIEAVDKNSKEVCEIINSNFVKQFPPCFRCNRNKLK